MSRKDITDEQVVQACADMALGAGPAAVEILEERTGQPYKVCIRALERAQDRGLIFCGVTIRRSFPTEKGKALLTERTLANSRRTEGNSRKPEAGPS